MSFPLVGNPSDLTKTFKTDSGQDDRFDKTEIFMICPYEWHIMKEKGIT
jgi:hypothetical protein